MDNSFKQNALLFLALFALLSVPALYSSKSPRPLLVEVVEPKGQGRRLASIETSGDAENCQIQERWRYKCDANNSNCKKDQKQFFKLCQK